MILTNVFCQPLCLGMHRSDYMLHRDEDDMDTDEYGRKICIRHVEFNTIAAGMGGLTSHMKDYHK